MAQTDVLVVGAGPTGLTLACDLARRGVAVRIVDRAPEFPGGSRGKGLSPRSLEVFDDLAVIDRMLASGITHMPHRKYRGAEVIAEIDPEAGRVPTPDIPYPTGLMIPSGGWSRSCANDWPASTLPSNWAPRYATSASTPMA